jgi:hypothetical protein
MVDLVSEKQHGYALSSRSPGHVLMKLLANPAAPREDLWDAARIVPPGISESFTLTGLDPGRPVRLILRAAPTEATLLDVELATGGHQRIELPRRDGWLEQRVELGSPGVTELTVRLTSPQAEHALFHAWAVQPE